MDRNKLAAILVMLMAVLGGLVLLFILGGGLIRAIVGPETSGIVAVTGSSVRRAFLGFFLAGVVIAVAVVLYRRVRR